MDALSKPNTIVSQSRAPKARSQEHPGKHPAVLEVLPEGLYNPPKGPPILFEGQPAYLSSQLALNTAVLYKGLEPDTISFLHRVISDPDVMQHLKDTTFSESDRNETNKLYLLLVAITRNSIRPFMEKEGTFYEEMINNATINTDMSDSNAAFEFGLKNNHSTSTHIAKQAHELEHLILGINYEFIPENIDGITIHEFICDLAGLNVLAKVSLGDKELFTQWVDNYVSDRNLKQIYENTRQKCSFVVGEHEYHNAARSTIYSIISECKKANLDLVEIVDTLHKGSLEQIEDYKAKGTLDNIKYTEFIKDLFERIKEPLKEKGISVELEPLQELSRNNVERFMKSRYPDITDPERLEACIQEHMKDLIVVPKAKIEMLAT